VAIGLLANLRAAVLAPFVSNPLTTPAILLAAYPAGQAVLGEATGLPGLAEAAGWLAKIGATGEPLLLGLALLAVTAATVTYSSVQLGCRHAGC